MEIQTLFVGVDGEQAVGSEETQKQIAEVKALECLLQMPTGEAVAWSDFDDPEEPRTLFRSILSDRSMRIDQRIPMADRPAFCVITATGGKALRLEYYEGHDALSLQYDVRAGSLQGQPLPAFMENDPSAYDRLAFLSEVLGSRVDFRADTLALVDQILDHVHRDL